MSTAMIDPAGSLLIPDGVGQRQGLLPNTKVRIVEMGCGMLVVPDDGEPMPQELADELAAWQAMGATAWNQFPS